MDIYLTGVQITCWHLEKGKDYSERFFGDKGFLEWSWLKYNLERPSFRLHHYLELAEGNEKSALDLFFQDLETFNTETSR